MLIFTAKYLSSHTHISSPVFLEDPDHESLLEDEDEAHVVSREKKKSLAESCNSISSYASSLPALSLGVPWHGVYFAAMGL